MAEKAPAPFVPHKTGRAIAWTALFFSLLAFGMSGYLLFQSYDDGRLVENFKILTTETSNVFDSARKRLQERNVDGLQWDKIQARVDRIEAMIRSKDTRAGYYIDVLKTDLDLLREYTNEKGAEALKSAGEALESAQARLTDDEEGAAAMLHDLREELEPRVRALRESLGEGFIDDEETEPAAADEAESESGAAPEAEKTSPENLKESEL